MGVIVEINGDIISVRFNDGCIRKYSKDNFIFNPVLNHVVQIYNDGTIVDLDERNKSDKKSKKMVLVVSIIISVLLVLFLIVILHQAFIISENVGRSCANEIKSCSN